MNNNDLISRACTSYADGNFQKTIRLCLKLCKKGRCSSEVLVLAARALLALDNKKFCKQWEKIFEEHCSSADDHAFAFAYGLFLRCYYNYEKSTEYLEKAVKLAPKQKDYYLELRKNYCYYLKDLEKEEKLLIKATKIFPKEADFWYFLGNIYRKKKELKKAKECYTKAAKIFPYNFRYCEGLGEVAFQLGEYDLAEDYLKKAFELEPVSSFVSWKLLLIIYYEIMGNLTKTEVLLEIVKQKALDVSEKWHLIGDFYLYKLKDYTRAFEAYLKVPVSEADIELLQSIVICATSLGEYDLAIKILHQAIRHYKTSNKYLLLAELFKARGDIDKAEKAYKSALNHTFLSSDLSDALVKYGEFLEREKRDTNTALEQYRQAFDTDQFNFVALSKIYKLTGKNDYLPWITSAVAKFGYILGKDQEYEALVLNNIEALGNIQYKYIFVFYQAYNTLPLLIVALETDPIVESENTFFFCTFIGEKHENYGVWNEALDIELFAIRALELVAKRFNIQLDTIKRVDSYLV